MSGVRPAGVRLESFSGGSGAGTSLGGGGAGGNPVTILTLKNANAADLSVLLERVYPILTVAVDERTNSLILRTDEQTLKTVTALVEQLDVPSKKAPVKP